MVADMSRMLGAMLFVLSAGIACGEANGDSGSGSTAGQPAAGQAGSAGAGNNAGSQNNGGSVNNAGSKSSGGGDDKGGAGAGGKVGSAGDGGAAPGGGSPVGGSSGAGEGGEGGGLQPDSRPGCSLAAEIAPTNLRVTEGAGPGGSAKLKVDVKNGSDQFVSYNPIKFSCTGAAVDSAMDVLGTFGISQGESNTINLQLDFKDSAKKGDVAHCTVRGYVMGQTPDDCTNAPTASIDVKVE